MPLDKSNPSCECSLPEYLRAHRNHSPAICQMTGSCSNYVHTMISCWVWKLICQKCDWRWSQSSFHLLLLVSNNLEDHTGCEWKSSSWWFQSTWNVFVSIKFLELTFFQPTCNSVPSVNQCIDLSKRVNFNLFGFKHLSTWELCPNKIGVNITTVWNSTINTPEKNYNGNGQSQVYNRNII